MALKPRNCIDPSNVDAILDALGISLDADFEGSRSLASDKGTLLVGDMSSLRSSSHRYAMTLQ
jgi:hypothetical protein